MKFIKHKIYYLIKKKKKKHFNKAKVKAKAKANNLLIIKK